MFLSLRFKAKRNPDHYSEHLMAFLKLSDPVAYKEYELFHFGEKNIKKETFVLNYKGNQYYVQKYCPTQEEIFLEDMSVMEFFIAQFITGNFL